MKTTEVITDTLEDWSDRWKARKFTKFLGEKLLDQDIILTSEEKKITHDWFLDLARKKRKSDLPVEILKLVVEHALMTELLVMLGFCSCEE